MDESTVNVRGVDGAYLSTLNCVYNVSVVAILVDIDLFCRISDFITV